MNLAIALLLLAFQGSGAPLAPASTPGILYAAEDGYRLLDPESGTSRLLRPATTVSETLLAPSPAGDAFALLSYAGLARRVWIQPFEGEARTVGPDFSPDYVQELQWSPDGRRIAVQVDGHTVGRGGVFVIDLEDGETRRITPKDEHEHWFWWSPDGERLAVAKTTRSEVERYADMIWVSRSSEVEIFHVGTGERERLTSAGHEIRELAWSPDGRWIAYKAGGGLWLLPAAGGGAPRRLETEERISNLGPPRFSPDGRLVAVSVWNKRSVSREKDSAPKEPDLLLVADLAALKPASWRRTAETEESTASAFEAPLRRYEFAENVWRYDWRPDGGALVLALDDGTLRSLELAGSKRRILARDAGFWCRLTWSSPR